MNALGIEIIDWFMAEGLARGRIVLGVTLLIAAYTFLDWLMGKLLDIVMTIPAGNVPVYSLGEHRRWNVIRAEDSFLSDAPHPWVLVAHQACFIVLESGIYR